jgi:uncharacterized membrane protein YphA (DoxX/SURF4 family)
MTSTPTTPRSEPWPDWAKAILAAILLLALAVVLPWILMWSGCLGAMGGVDGMRQMMDGVRR